MSADSRPVPDPPVPSLACPRAAVLADRLLAPARHAVDSEELVALRTVLGRDLQTVASDLPAGASLRLDAHALRTARRHPERCMDPGDGFRPAPRLCRRDVGGAAVRLCVRGMAPGPSAAVATVLGAALAELSEDRSSPPPWWAEWYARLPAGGRAVVHAEAAGWATRLLTALEWRRFPRPPLVGGRDDWWRCPGGGDVVLRGRADVRVPVERRVALLVLGSGSCPQDWRLELGFPGLVAALVREPAAAPSRVVGLWPDSGQLRVFELDLAALEGVATEVVSAAATWVDGRIEAGRTRRAGAVTGARASA